VAYLEDKDDDGLPSGFNCDIFTHKSIQYKN